VIYEVNFERISIGRRDHWRWDHWRKKGAKGARQRRGRRTGHAACFTGM
jgi:hypothetical protein